jgi:hypothetical protein
MCHPFDSRNNRPSLSVGPLALSLLETMETVSSWLTKRLLSADCAAMGAASTTASIKTGSNFMIIARLIWLTKGRGFPRIKDRVVRIVRSVFRRPENCSVGTLNQGRELCSGRNRS